MENHQDNEATSHFFYHDLFRICKKLKKETNKLEQIISTSKGTIFYLASINLPVN